MEKLQVINDLLTLFSGTDFYAILEALATNGTIVGTVILVVICIGVKIFLWVRNRGKSPPEQTTLNTDVNQDQTFDWPEVNIGASFNFNLGTKKESHPPEKGNSSRF